MSFAFISLQQSASEPESLVPVLVALIAALPGLVSLAVQIRRDAAESKLKRISQLDEATTGLIDQYQEELQNCRQERAQFTKERVEWESERLDLLRKIRLLELDNVALNKHIEHLQNETDKLKLEIDTLKGLKR